MKLIELFATMDLSNDTWGYIIDPPYYFVNGEQLEKYKEEILKCDEFKNVEELVILKSPYILNSKNDKIVKLETLKIDDNVKFYGKVYLYGISLYSESDNDTLNTVIDFRVRGVFDYKDDELNLDLDNYPCFFAYGCEFIENNENLNDDGSPSIEIKLKLYGLSLEAKEYFIDTFKTLTESEKIVAFAKEHGYKLIQ